MTCQVRKEVEFPQGIPFGTRCTCDLTPPLVVPLAAFVLYILYLMNDSPLKCEPLRGSSPILVSYGNQIVSQLLFSRFSSAFVCYFPV